MNFSRGSVVLACLFPAVPLMTADLAWGQTPVAFERNDADESVIITAASGKVALPPSHSVLTVVVETRSKSAAQASSENSRAQARVLDTLRSLGYGRQQVESADYSVRPNMSYDDREKLIDYEASLDLRVRVDSLAALGAIIDAVLGAGGSEIRGISFFADSVDRGRQEALAEALQRARRDATSLAEAADGRLGRLLEVSTIPPVSVPSSSLTLYPGVVGSGYLLVEPHSVEVKAEVFTRWVLER